jgi:hypothetical protein
VRPRCQAPRQRGPDRADECLVGIGGHQLHPDQAAGGQVPEETEPARAVLGRGDLQPEDLPMPVTVDPGGDQGVHVDHPPALPPLEH